MEWPEGVKVGPKACILHPAINPGILGRWMSCQTILHRFLHSHR